MSTQWISHSNGISWEESTLLRHVGLCHGVTGCEGGASRGAYESLNLSLAVGDDVTAVLENRRRLSEAIGVAMTRLTFAQPIGADHVVAVGDAECGRGAGAYEDALPHTDIIMTNKEDVPLVITVADAVPIILYDPVQRACAVVHSCVQNIVHRAAEKAVWAMAFAYGSKATDICAYIGPSISKKYLTVSSTIGDSMLAMGTSYEACVEKTDSCHVDLALYNTIVLQQAGITASHRELSTRCVYEDRGFFSYRRSYGKTGRMAAFAMIERNSQC